jgi:cytochrome c-type biogenesis protein CcmH/NrfG
VRGPRAAASLAALAALALLARPELSRYAAERRLGDATNAFRLLIDRGADAETARNLLVVGEAALGVAGALPGDPRAWILGGSAYLVTSQPQPALEAYREAFATGERAEIDLNLGRAYAMLNRKENAERAFVRAGWVSPEILKSLPEAQREPASAEVQRLTGELYRGVLTEPPPLPSDERR